ncbi:MAG: hypothetical protein KDB03_20320 [Planctomycetales bacterium]|nr:hypothetical protein [Planctomycetales bacterium]
MLTWKLTLGSLVVLIANLPPYWDPTTAAIRSLRAKGYRIEGRDPCDGAGFCCALLPASEDGDVYYVTLPQRGWNMSQLRHLKRFENLKSIRADRAVTPTEFDTLCETLQNQKDLLLVYVQNPDGTRTWTRRDD